MHVCFLLQADSANSTAEGAINDYYPEGNENFDGSVNEAVDFVQETVSME